MSTIPSSSLLEVIDLHVHFGSREVLHGINLRVAAGEIVALLGANGAGKTTTLSTIAGMFPIQSGQIHWQGGSLPSSADAVLRRGICLCPEGRRIFSRLTVEENLCIGSFVRDSKKDRQKIDRAYTHFPILADRRRQLGGTLSGGEQQMLAIARALMSEPTLLMLDEPSLGLAPLIVEKIFEIIQSIHADGTTILLVEQNARLALRLANRGYVMAAGQIVLEDSSANLLASDEIRRAYLGEE